jgi:hypothetical protein
MCLRGGFAGLGLAGQDSAAFFEILPEMTVARVDWLVGDRGDGGEFGLLGDRFVLLGWRGVLGDLRDGVFGVDAELYAGGVFLRRCAERG